MIRLPVSPRLSFKAIFSFFSRWRSRAFLLFLSLKTETSHRHATISWGKSVFFQRKSVSIRILHICINVSRKRSRDSYHDAVFAKKIATLCNKNRHPAAKNQNRSFRPTSRGATVGLGLRLWLTRSIVLHRRRNLPFFGNLAEKASYVDDKTVFFATHIHELFFSNLPQIRITTWYGRIISKKAKIRIGYGQSVPGGMSAVRTLKQWPMIQ